MLLCSFRHRDECFALLIYTQLFFHTSGTYTAITGISNGTRAAHDVSQKC